MFDDLVKKTFDVYHFGDHVYVADNLVRAEIPLISKVGRETILDDVRERLGRKFHLTYAVLKNESLEDLEIADFDEIAECIDRKTVLAFRIEHNPTLYNIIEGYITKEEKLRRKLKEHPVYIDIVIASRDKASCIQLRNIINERASIELSWIDKVSSDIRGFSTIDRIIRIIRKKRRITTTYARFFRFLELPISDFDVEMFKNSESNYSDSGVNLGKFLNGKPAKVDVSNCIIPAGKECTKLLLKIIDEVKREKPVILLDKYETVSYEIAGYFDCLFFHPIKSPFGVNPIDVKSYRELMEVYRVVGTLISEELAEAVVNLYKMGISVSIPAMEMLMESGIVKRFDIPEDYKTEISRRVLSEDTLPMDEIFSRGQVTIFSGLNGIAEAVASKLIVEAELRDVRPFIIACSDFFIPYDDVLYVSRMKYPKGYPLAIFRIESFEVDFVKRLDESKLDLSDYILLKSERPTLIKLELPKFERRDVKYTRRFEPRFAKIRILNSLVRIPSFEDFVKLYYFFQLNGFERLESFDGFDGEYLYEIVKALREKTADDIRKLYVKAMEFYVSRRCWVYLTDFGLIVVPYRNGRFELENAFEVNVNCLGPGRHVWVTKESYRILSDVYRTLGGRVKFFVYDPESGKVKIARI